MKWSFRILRVSGIDVRVHATFAFSVVLFALHFAEPHGLRGAAFGVLLLCALFLCLTLHELGHSLVAQRLGVSVSEILLLPIGGVARLTSEPKKPVHELLIAVAGPAVNALIACGLYAVLRHYTGGVFSALHDAEELAEPSALGLCRALFFGNCLLAVFNMIPALPMDGGRVFRALLSLAIGRSRATRIAAGMGQVIALGLCAYGLHSQDPMLVLIGVFVFVGAAQERTSGRTAELLSELRAGEVCDPNAIVFAPHEPLAHVLDTLIRSPQAHFAVFYGKELVGTVAREHVLLVASRVGLQAPLASVMRREFFAVDGGMPLDEVRRKLLELGGRPVVVRSLTGFAGVLGYEDVQRIALVSERLAHAGIRRPQPAPDPALH